MNTNDFSLRHIGVGAQDAEEMLRTIGVKTLDELIAQTLPDNIRLSEPLDLPEPMTEREFAEHIAYLASKNEVFTTSARAGTTPSCPQSSSATYWRTPLGTPPTRPIRPRSRRDASRRSSTSSPSSPTSRRYR